MSKRVLALFGLLLCCPLLATAQVRLTVGLHGRKVIHDGGGVEAPRGTSRREALKAVPKAELEPLIDQHCDSHELDPRLVQAVIQVESNYNVNARSRKGAIGLMQLMPATAVTLAVDDPYDPDQNIRGGTRYLRQMIDRFGGQIELALAAYNAGPAAVERYGGVPPYRETRDYVRRVMALYQGADAPLVWRVRGESTIVVRGASGRPLLTTRTAGKR